MSISMSGECQSLQFLPWWKHVHLQMRSLLHPCTFCSTLDIGQCQYSDARKPLIFGRWKCQSGRELQPGLPVCNPIWGGGLKTSQRSYIDLGSFWPPECLWPPSQNQPCPLLTCQSPQTLLWVLLCSFEHAQHLQTPSHSCQQSGHPQMGTRSTPKSCFAMSAQRNTQTSINFRSCALISWYIKQQDWHWLWQIWEKHAATCCTLYTATKPAICFSCCATVLGIIEHGRAS